MRACPFTEHVAVALEASSKITLLQVVLSAVNSAIVAFNARFTDRDLELIQEGLLCYILGCSALCKVWEVKSGRRWDSNLC
jgi:hypothetical protein